MIKPCDGCLYSDIVENVLPILMQQLIPNSDAINILALPPTIWFILPLLPHLTFISLFL